MAQKAAVLWSSVVGGGHAIVPNLGCDVFYFLFTHFLSDNKNPSSGRDLEKLKSKGSKHAVVTSEDVSKDLRHLPWGGGVCVLCHLPLWKYRHPALG